MSLNQIMLNIYVWQYNSQQYFQLHNSYISINMQEEATPYQYNFIKQIKLNFGEALYLIGSSQLLGNWTPAHALQMKCIADDQWIISICLNSDQKYQYKYFVGKFHIEPKPEEIVWIGDQNQRLCVPFSMIQKFNLRQEELSIMSFNVRLENKYDTGVLSWEERRQNCVAAILQNVPDFVGIQEPKKKQREYMHSALSQYYHYYGKPRDLKEDEESGIFVRRDRFIVRQDKYIWINENKEEAKKGFDARLPRYFTSLLISKITSEMQPDEDLILVINTHLDHQSQASRQKGIEFISQHATSEAKRWPNLRSVFVLGDFNTHQNDQIFDSLLWKGVKIESMRKQAPENKVDRSKTFNGFNTLAMRAASVVEHILTTNDHFTIDHIFSNSQDYASVEFLVLKDEQKVVSDHYPILGKFMKK